jgi:hypothetical protein
MITIIRYIVANKILYKEFNITKINKYNNNLHTNNHRLIQILYKNP